MSFFEKFKQNKKISVLIIIVIFLGLFLRFNDFGEESYHGDCEAYFSPALLWFYPHTYYPGLSGQGEPAFGHYFIGLGCLASGEDFSKITEVRPMFYPGRQILIGKEVINAERYCNAPIYVFGLLFFMIIIIFALILLDIYSAAYFISFFAFFPTVLYNSRWIQINIFAFFFSILGFLFLWKAYTSVKSGKKELIFFIFSSINFSLTFSSKTPGAVCIIFLAFILIEKYKDETFFILNSVLESLGINLLSRYKNKENLNLKAFIKLGFASVFAYISVLFVTFEFNLINIFRVIQQYRSHSGDINTIGFSHIFIYKAFLEFLYSINPLDMLVFFFSVYIFVKLLFKKEKTKLEKFIIYSVSFLILLSLTFQIVSALLRVFIIFFWGLILLMSLAFSDKDYSVANLLKVNRNTLFFVFMIVYIPASFYIGLSDSPYFSSPPNKVLCLLNKERCTLHHTNLRTEAEFIKSLLKEDETFLPTGFINYYLRREDDIIWYTFRQQVIMQLNREPSLGEYVNYYHPMNRTVRYVLVSPLEKERNSLNLGLDYEPNYRIKIKGIDSVWVYDVQNLTKRK